MPDFESCFKVHNLISVHPKSIKLGQMISLIVISHLVLSLYRLVKTGNFEIAEWSINQIKCK